MDYDDYEEQNNLADLANTEDLYKGKVKQPQMLWGYCSQCQSAIMTVKGADNKQAYCPSGHLNNK